VSAVQLREIMYGSDLFTYDFETALANARVPEPHPDTKEDLTDLGARQVCATPGMKPVSLRQLERHIQLYGDGCVDDLMPYLLPGAVLPDDPSGNGSTMRSETASTSKVGSGPWGTVRTQNLGFRIVKLHERGLMPSAIADRVRKSDGIVRRYLREAEAAGLIA
jgi:hypothetical protein